uniref:Uncharacterized protein n=1 Tax=Taeniopygia guttata TaxID=59729 RepID=A0A674GPQ4_TAEGU
MLLEAGASTEGKDERGQTALSYAVSQGSENTAKVLLEAGATVDSNTVERAFNSDHPSIFKILLEYSKDLSADIMELALFRAVQKNQHSVVAALIDRGTDINTHNKKHYTPLLLACEMGKVESAEVLMEKGANLGIRTPAADTALHLAVQAGAASIAGLLLSKGMDTNLRNQAEETPLHFAALHNHGALVGLLVGAGAKSPLHLAAEQGHQTLAEMLLKARADPNAQDKEKKTPLHAAALRGHLSIVEMLLAKKGRTALHLAAEYGHGELINLLLSHGAAINASDSSRDTALHCACRAGHLGAVSALLGWARGEKANLLALNSLRKTPLQVAELSKTENQDIGTHSLCGLRGSQNHLRWKRSPRSSSPTCDQASPCQSQHSIPRVDGDPIPTWAGCSNV